MKEQTEIKHEQNGDSLDRLVVKDEKRRLVLDRRGIPRLELKLLSDGTLTYSGVLSVLFELGTVLHPVPDTLHLAGEEGYLAGVTPIQENH